MASSPILHIIAGPNGAGKTTFYEAYLRDRTDAEFVNPDRLVEAVLGRHALTRSEAARGQALANSRRAELMAAAKSLVTESTFSHISKVDLVREAIALGYDVILYHVCVDSADLAVARVGERHDNGGHPVPEANIRGRYERNGDFIRQAMNMAHGGFVFDNSLIGQPPRRLITFSAGKIIAVVSELPEWAGQIYTMELAELAARS